MHYILPPPNIEYKNLNYSDPDIKANDTDVLFGWHMQRHVKVLQHILLV